MKYVFHVEKSAAGQRLDHFLAAQVPHLSRTRLQSLIKSAHALVNDHAARPGNRLRRDDVVSMEEPAAVPVEIAAEDLPLEVLFEDDDLIVINKPAGMVVHPGAGNPAHTLVNALVMHCANLSGIGGELRPGIVHRLDKETSGSVVVAKNDFTHGHLARQFAGRTVTKIYLALAAGQFERASGGVIETLIGRHPVSRKKMAVVKRGGRLATTRWRVVQEVAAGSVVECTLHTGRTHQIRVHLRHLGHPILGDKLYAPRTHAEAFPRQMLHAWNLGFVHPRTGEIMNFSSPLPADFVEAGVTLPAA